MTYVGARGRISVGELERLDLRRWLVTEKVDGAYCEVHTDARGLVSRLVSRTGRDFGESVADLIGIDLGCRSAVLVGELEAHTEASVAAVEARGYRNVWLHDVLTARGGQEVKNRPLSDRRAELRQIAYRGGLPERASVLDAKQRLHDPLSGRFISAPRDASRFPVLRRLTRAEISSAWDAVREGAMEGLVAANLRAPAGRRGSKLKAKLIESWDCVVVEASRTRATVQTFGRTFSVGCKGLTLEPGAVVEVRFEGLYADGVTPRFPRIVRERVDLRRAA